MPELTLEIVPICKALVQVPDAVLLTAEVPRLGVYFDLRHDTEETQLHLGGMQVRTVRFRYPNQLASTAAGI